MSVERDNQRFLNILSRFLNFEDDAISPSDVDAVSAVGVDRSYAFSLLLAERYGVDVENADRRFFNDYFLPSVKNLKAEDYYSDEYYKYIDFTEETFGDFKLTKLSVKPCQAFVRDDFAYYPDGRVVPLIGFFDKEYTYPAVLQGGREWMTLLPNEINSQLKYIGAASGNVLTYGLGLGYYVLKVALKSDVRSVTVVDIDQNVIDLFSRNILIKFPEFAKSKVRLVNADALQFAKNLKGGRFDYVYADIWRDVSDGLDLYKALKQTEVFSPGSRFGYWIEDTMKYYL